LPGGVKQSEANTITGLLQHESDDVLYDSMTDEFYVDEIGEEVFDNVQ
jgi:hypothetical protein